LYFFNRPSSVVMFRPGEGVSDGGIDSSQKGEANFAIELPRSPPGQYVIGGEAGEVDLLRANCVGQSSFVESGRAWGKYGLPPIHRRLARQRGTPREPDLRRRRAGRDGQVADARAEASPAQEHESRDRQPDGRPARGSIRGRCESGA
jgi:hypothetical protein